MKTNLISITILLLFIAQIYSFEYYIDTRQVTESVSGEGPNFAEDLKEQILNGESIDGYCRQEQPIMPFNKGQSCGGDNQNIGWIFSYTFLEEVEEGREYNEWEFKFDAFLDRGFAVYIDDEYQFSRNTLTSTCVQDIEETYNETNYGFLVDQDAGTRTTMKSLIVNAKLRSGSHNIKIYGSESGSFGTFDVKFSKNGGSFQEFRYNNLKCELNIPDILITTTAKKHPDQIIGSSSEYYAQKLLAASQRSTIPGGTCYVVNPDWPLYYGNPCGRNSEQTIWNYQLDFHILYKVALKFKIGAEFQGGYAVYINDELYEAEQGEYFYWYDDWSNEGVIVIEKEFDLGIHKINIVGIEGSQADNGSSSMRFKVVGVNGWHELTQQNWQQYIPKPVELIVETRHAGSVRESSFGSKSNKQQYSENIVEAFKNASDNVPGYCRRIDPIFPFHNRSLCGGNNYQNILWEFNFKFMELEYFENEEDRPIYYIEFGSDFGWGSTIYINGVWQDLYVLGSNQDEWWSGSWNGGGIFRVQFRAEKGQQLVQLYGGEGCCDGDVDVRIKRNDNGWHTFSEYQKEYKFEYCDLLEYIGKQGGDTDNGNGNNNGNGNTSSYSQIIIPSLISILVVLILV